jgi:hypothetical protein
MKPPHSDPKPAPEPKCAPTSRPKRRRYDRHGLVTLKASVRALGPRVIDKRTRLGKQLAEWRADLIRDLGGKPSTAELALVDLAVRSKLMLDSIDAWLLVQPSLVNARKRAVLPVVRERQAQADGLLRALDRLGLASRAQEPPASLAEYIAQHDGRRARH